jgi:hypothetical protein
MTVHFTGPVVHTDHASGTDTKYFYTEMPVGWDPDYVYLYDDFLFQFESNNWETVLDGGASVTLASDELNGAIVISSAATTDDDGGLVQCDEEVFKLESGKRLWAETRVKVSDADQMDFFFGLSTAVATNPENILTTGDRAGFQVDDENASLLAKSEKDNTETSTDTSQDMADDTYVILSIYWDGVDTIHYLVDRVARATHTTNIPDDENLSVCMFHLSGDAVGTHTSTWDYVLVIKER